MDEEQAVLDFFSRAENLPLALSVAEHIDRLRAQMNNSYWQEMHQRVVRLIAPHKSAWSVELTADRNSTEDLVGLHCNPSLDQHLFLQPMLEQQLTGDNYRIYVGLMWSAHPDKDVLNLPEVQSLKAALTRSGLQENANYLGWQWSRLHPRRRDFLLRFSRDREDVLGETEALIRPLLIDHIAAIDMANSALIYAPRSQVVSLETLRSKRDS